jgi:drug/metabolite transporter (DMT)-like permease
MSRKLIAIALLIPFSALTVYAVIQVGYVGIFEYQIHSPAGWQVFADLVVALALVLTWMIPDAKRNGRNPWPWVIGTLFTGSIAPLLYLATSKANGAATS